MTTLRTIETARQGAQMKSILMAALCSLLIVASSSVAVAGRGGSNSRIRNAIATGSSQAIIAELERAERLVCGACIGTVMNLLDDDRYEVREAAAWWFARRPAQKQEITERSLASLQGSDSIQARNAADILGAFKQAETVSALAQAAGRSDLSAEARQAAVRALGLIGIQRANPALAQAMSDSDAGVRLAAVTAWNAIPYQQDAAAVTTLIGDSDVLVRRKAAAVAGDHREASARAALESQLAGDSDAMVRRNAAWALGRIGDAASRSVLEAARNDSSPLVRAAARVALRGLR